MPTEEKAEVAELQQQESAVVQFADGAGGSPLDSAVGGVGVYGSCPAAAAAAFNWHCAFKKDLQNCQQALTL